MSITVNTSSKLYDTSDDELLKFSLVELVHEFKKSSWHLKKSTDFVQCLVATRHGKGSSITPDLVKGWKESSTVYDNINPYVKPRHQTSSTGNELYSMTHGLMIRDRVPTAHLAGRPPKPLHDITPSALLRSDTNKDMVHEAFTRIICDTWAENVSSLSWMAKDISRHICFNYT